MNDPKDQPIDIAEQREWLVEHKKDTGATWKVLGARTGVKESTLSLFAGNHYNAPGDAIAEAIFRYRQTLAAQAAMKGELPDIPSYYETETSKQLLYLLSWAQRGRIVAAALSPGCSKTMAAEHYKACNANVFLMTASPGTASLTSMMNAVLQALGQAAMSYVSHTLSRAIKDRVRNIGNALLIIDEAQHLSDRAIDEIRSWHDATGLGIALFGNAGLMQTLEGGNRSIGRAQLFSRISLKIVRTHPLTADVEALLDAWRLRDAKVCAYVHSIAQKPGGLRGATFALEIAHMIAAAGGEELAVGHVQDAWAQLSTRPVAA